MSVPLLPAPVVSRNLPEHPRNPTSPTNKAAAGQPQLSTPPGGAQGQSLSYTLDSQGVGPSYLDYIRRIAKGSPILHSLYTKDYSSPRKVDVMILDIKDDGTYLNPKIFGDSESILEYLKYGHHLLDPSATPEILGYNYFLLRNFLKDPKPPEVAVRLIFVEDLSPAMIEALGSTLDLDPHFFAKHLVGAKYHTVADDLGSKGVLRETSTNRAFDMELKKYVRCSWNRRALGIAKLEVIAGKRVQQSNIYRPYERISLKDSSYTVGEDLNPTLDPDGIIPDTVMAEERMSFLVKDDDHGWTGVFLFDPLREKALIRPLLNPGEDGTLDEKLQYRVLHGFDYRNIQPAPTFSKFTGPQDTQMSNRFKIKRTRNEFVEYLISTKGTIGGRSDRSCACGNSQDLNDSSTFLHLIFHFMLYDWGNVLDDVGGFLNEVDTRMSDNITLQEKLATWRIVFGNLRKILVEESEKVRAILRATDTYSLGGLETSFRDTLDRIDIMKDHTEKTFAALMSSIAIVESQRAISQAESISRLTELAFFFIPLSFATSLFSMQIPGWSENYKPYMWPVVSASMVLGAYSSRIIVRSRPVHYATDRIQKSVREYSGVAPGAPIPVTYFLYSLLYWLTPPLLVREYWFPLVYAILGVVGVSLTWTLVDSLPLKVGLTISAVVCLIVICIACVTDKMTEDERGRWWLDLAAGLRQRFTRAYIREKISNWKEYRRKKQNESKRQKFIAAISEAQRLQREQQAAMTRY